MEALAKPSEACSPWSRLRSREMEAVLRIATAALKSMVDLLVWKGFSWILPVILSKSTDPLWPDNAASIEKRIELEVYGQRVKTMQSMIVHKRILVSLGPEKVFVISPNIRIESERRAETGRHIYEFNQLDLEVAYGNMDELFRLFEELIIESIRCVKNGFEEELKLLGRDLKVPEAPFKVYKRRELMEAYGECWGERVSKGSRDPVWVTDLPREFYDFEDDASGEWRNFDLILPEGFGELISGGEREYEYEKLIKKMRRDNLRIEDYSLLLRLAEEGRLKPSAGAGLGIERFIAYICGAGHVAEVQPFPRIPGVVPEL
ncbi:MAG: asparagine synthetase A [Candidatus Bathyarchaeia archaeon]